MLNPVNRAGANELEERYIGTAYEKIKVVADNIEDIATVAQAVRDADNFKGTYTNEALLVSNAIGAEGGYAYVDAGVGTDVVRYSWDNDDSSWVQVANEVTDYGTPSLFLQPVMGVSYSDCTLAGDGGLDVTLPPGSRFLVRSQTDPTENGVYTTSDGSWLRATDFVDATHLLNGMLIVNTSLQDGLNVNVFVMTFSGEYIVGATELTFTQLRFI